MIDEITVRGEASPASTPALRWIGNATVLLELNGIRVLTDPNFLHAGDHAHIGYGMTTKRLKSPALAFEDLPPIDVVLLSHYHGDHFDQLVEAKLARDMPIVTTTHAATTLRGKGFTNMHALNTWDTCAVRSGDREIRITSMPGKHGPGMLSNLLPPVMGSIIDVPVAGASDLRLYLSGDTLVHEALHEIPRRYPNIDVALLHLGGTRVFGVLVTLDGKGGVAALQIIQPHIAIPVHYEEYTVMKSPLSDFIAEAEAAGFADRIRILERGARFELLRAGDPARAVTTR